MEKHEESTTGKFEEGSGMELSTFSISTVTEWKRKIDEDREEK